MRKYQLILSALIPLLLTIDSKASYVTSEAFFYRPRYSNLTSLQTYNPVFSVSGITQIPKSVGIAYSNRFLLKETNSFMIFGSKSWEHVSVAFSIDYFGTAAYWLHTSQFVIAKKLNSQINVGLSCNGNLYGSNFISKPFFIVAPSVSVMAQLTKKIVFYSKLHNITHSEGLKEGFNVAQVSLAYRFKKASLHLQFEKQKKYYLESHFFAEYSCNKVINLYFRASKSNEPIGLGIEYKTKNVKYAIQLFFHNYLGTSTECIMYK